MTRDRSPRREPRRRPLPKRRCEHVARPASAPTPDSSGEADPVISHIASRYEDADFLQRSAENAFRKSAPLGPPVFGVSGWIVAPPAEPFPPGFARVSTLASFGIQVVATPYLGRNGHVTILLEDPVDHEQADRLNEAFGVER